MQITRQRVRPEMHIETTENCPSCLGSGKVESTVLFTETIYNTLIRVMSDYKLNSMIVKTHPFIEAYINKGYFNSLRKKWAKDLKCDLKVISDLSVNLLEFKLYDKHGDEILYMDGVGIRE
jgi:ribonuclease G